MEVSIVRACCLSVDGGLLDEAFSLCAFSLPSSFTGNVATCGKCQERLKVLHFLPRKGQSMSITISFRVTRPGETVNKLVHSIMY
eukprot:165530-Prymnesium_polylepis.1